MAEVIVREKLAQEGLADAVTVTSSGIGGWHVGQKVDERARRELAAHGYDGEAHRAQQFGFEQEQADLIVALDDALTTRTPRPSLVYVRAHAGTHGNEMADRYASTY